MTMDLENELMRQSAYEQSISDAEIWTALDTYERHEADERIIKDRNAKTRIIVPAIKRHFIAAAILEDPEHTRKLETLGNNFHESAWFHLPKDLEETPITRFLINCDGLEFRKYKMDENVIYGSVPKDILEQTSKRLKSIFDETTESYGVIQCYKPKAGRKGIDPRAHADISTMIVNTSSYGAPMIWFPEIDGRTHKMKTGNPSNYIQNKTGDVMIFNDQLLHASSPDVPKKGAMNVVIDFLYLNAPT
jgi:hypothetical protein